MEEVLQALDQEIYRSKARKKHCKVERRNDKKAILTTFGQLEYKRTYYRHKDISQYAYLLDERAGITSRMRVSSTVKAELTENTAQGSYEKPRNR